MVQRHLRAHKWFAQCTDLLQYIDPQGLIPDGTVRIDHQLASMRLSTSVDTRIHLSYMGHPG